ncbi:MAG TPA: NUDIX hydrolase [Pseudonocardiaceae bacterium]
MSEAEASSLVHVLNAFGALGTTVDPLTGMLAVKADTPVSALFLRSLAEYVEHDAAILHNWARNGTTEPPYDEQAVLLGPQFLYFMERRRVSCVPGATVLRRVQVSQVVVKRVGRLRGPEYLVLQDPATHQYQLPGGRARRGDQQASDVARRELQEELPGFVFAPAVHGLVDLGTVGVTAVSRTYGVNTSYDMSFFQLRSQADALPTGPGARWVPEDVLLGENAQVEGMTLNMAGLRELHRTLPGGIGALPTSLANARRGALTEVARRKPLEFWGLAIGVLGVVLTVVIFVIQV